MGRSKKLMLIALLVGAIILMTESTVWAAQGQITEVNPSGIGKMMLRVPSFVLTLLSNSVDGLGDLLQQLSTQIGQNLP